MSHRAESENVIHPYYQKNAGKLKKKIFGFYQMIRDEIAQEFGIPYEKAAEEIWDYYEKNLIAFICVIWNNNLATDA